MTERKAIGLPLQLIVELGRQYDMQVNIVVLTHSPRLDKIVYPCHNVGIYLWRIVHTLKTNADGSPRHPLYVGYDVLPQPFLALAER
jgi:hypothetical protein